MELIKEGNLVRVKDYVYKYAIDRVIAMVSISWGRTDGRGLVYAILVKEGKVWKIEEWLVEPDLDYTTYTLSPE